MQDWEPLGAVDPRSLSEARLQLHWMAQAAAAVGKRLLPHQPDYSEQSFQWCPVLRALVQDPVAAGRPFRAGLRPSPPALLLAAEDDGTRSIGVGLSPGDDRFSEPYFYVLPWPAPKGELPGLAGGGWWHTEGWTGAVLEASRFTAAEAQARQVEAFVDSAIKACRRLL